MTMGHDLGYTISAVSEVSGLPDFRLFVLGKSISLRTNLQQRCPARRFIVVVALRSSHIDLSL